MTDGPNALEAIRRDIDNIDTELLALLKRRFEASARVKAAKAGGPAAPPMRPARDAMILRRLCEAEAGNTPLPLRAQLWRAIISSSTLAQAPVRIHLAAGLFESAEARLAIRDFFGLIPAERHASEDAALMALGSAITDVAVVDLAGGWASHLAEGRTGRIAVTGVLPFLAAQAAPQYAILSHAAQEPTGSDETLIVTNGQLPRDFDISPLWQAQQGRLMLTSLPGFLDERAQPLLGILRANGLLGLKVLGRYPSPIDVSSA